MSSDAAMRFGGVARVLGAAAVERLRAAHVAIIGVGGVGSWAVEAMARSGVGELTLVDLDEVCLTNVNRQLPALTSTVGRSKVAVLAERVADIHPAARVHVRAEFFTADTAADLLAARYDAVLDAMDSPSLKALLLARCREQGIPVVTSGGAGGRRDPTRIRVADLALTGRDPLLAEVRGRLRREFGFPRGGRLFGVDAVYSLEPLLPPAEGCGEAETEGGGAACERRFGALCFVTAAFGMAAAAQVVARLLGTVEGERAWAVPSPAAGRE